MQNIIKNGDYFYRNRDEFCDKWSFIKKEKSSGILNIVLPVLLLSSVLLVIL